MVCVFFTDAEKLGIILKERMMKAKVVAFEYKEGFL